MPPPSALPPSIITAAADASVVEEKMDLAGVLTLCDFIAKPLHLRFVGDMGDVRGNEQALRQAPRLAEPLRFCHRVRKDIAHRDIAAFGDQLANELSAHTRAAASHDCDPAREILHTRTSLGFRHLSLRKGHSLALSGVKANRPC